jgi:hypothetical protein
VSVASASSPAVSAQPATGVLPTPSDPQAADGTPGLVLSKSELVDPVFRIHIKGVALERIVHMLQWQRSEGGKPGYDQVWSSERIGPEGLDAAHANTMDFPFNGERWWTQDATLDGHAVSAEALAVLDRQEAWWTLKPDVSQMPGNLAASFQPDGVMLSTSQDPAHPQVGDIRVEWRVIRNPPAPAGIALVDGVWKTAPAATPATEVSPASPHVLPVGTDTSQPNAWLGLRAYWMIAVAAGLLLIVLLWRRMR